MKRKRNNKIKLVALILVLCITLGYAALRTGLNINGTAKISNATWDVHFENAQATGNSTVIPTTAPSAPAASKLQTISYDVTFDTPGQVYEFTVDVKNGGSIDAMIESFTSKIKVGDGEEATIAGDKSNLPTYLDYDVTYSDDVAIANNHLLAADDSETIKVRVEFKRDITNAQLEDASGKTITLNVGINYVQADENAVESHPEPNFVYTINEYNRRVEGKNSVWLGQVFPTKMEVSKETAQARGVYLKHKLKKTDTTIYCLVGTGTDEYNSCDDSDMSYSTLSECNDELSYYEEYPEEGVTYSCSPKILSIVTESYVEILVNDANKQQMISSECNTEDETENEACQSRINDLVNGTYTLRGFDYNDLYDSETNECKTEYYDEENDQCVSPYYESNVNEIKKMFGTLLSKDEYTCSFEKDGISCEPGAGLYAYASTEGSVQANFLNFSCSASVNNSACY